MRVDRAESHSQLASLLLLLCMPDTCDALNKENVRKILGEKCNSPVWQQQQTSWKRPNHHQHQCRQSPYGAAVSHDTPYKRFRFCSTFLSPVLRLVPFRPPTSWSWHCLSLWLNLVLVRTLWQDLPYPLRAPKEATYAASVGVFIRKSVCLTVACTCGLANVAACVRYFFFWFLFQLTLSLARNLSTMLFLNWDST